MIKPGTILWNKFKEEYFIVVTSDIWQQNDRGKFRQWHYRVQPIDGRWTWWQDKHSSGSWWRTTGQGGNNSSDWLNIGDGSYGYPSNTIFPGHFNKLGWSIAPKATQVLYGSR